MKDRLDSCLAEFLNSIFLILPSKCLDLKQKLAAARFGGIPKPLASAGQQDKFGTTTYRRKVILLRTFNVFMVASAILALGAGCSPNSAGNPAQTGADAWKKTAPPPGYAAEVAAHKAAGAPKGGGIPANSPSPASTP
jgi:hypothetical protein